MPHDANGKLLRPGDLVNIPCTVMAVHEGGDGRSCNLDLELDLSMPCRDGAKDRYCAINTRQVVKRVGGKLYPCGCQCDRLG